MQEDNFQPIPWAIKLIVAVLVAIELVIQVGELGFVQIDDIRLRAFTYGALWPAVVAGEWQPMYAGQKYAMLLSHAFLHGSLLHMAMNTVVILGLGKRLGAVLNDRQLFLLFAVTAAAGGIGYLLMNDGYTPAVGASGAVFGFFGVWKYFEYMARKRMGLSLVPIWQFIGALAVLNVALYFMLGGLLAWQAHVGGFVAGWLLGVVFARRGGQAAQRPRR